MSDVINIIPLKDISFKTKSLLEDILNRLELSQRDRIDLQRYIEFGGGENLDNIKETLEFVRDNLDIFIENRHNFEIFVEYVDKIYALFEEAPEEFDTLKEIADTILKHVNEDFKEFKDEVAKSNESINEEINKRLKIEDSPIEKGEGENSAVLKGEYEGYSNKAISQTSMAVGAATTAGLKGWYYSAIDFSNKTITLSDKPTYILVGTTLINGGWSSGTPNIKVNDVISLVNNSKYDFCSKVTAVNGNVITVDNLPFTGLLKDSGAAAAVLAGQFSDGYSIYIPERPDAGIIDFGGGAFSEGSLSKATNIAAHAEGLQTHAYGQYSHTEGRETKAGYIAHAEGSKNEAIGNASHAEGTENIAVNSNTHVEGRYTKATGYAAHAEGYGESLENPNLAQGNYSHVEGEKTKSLGIASHAEGGSSIAKGNFSHSEGRFTRAHALCSHAEGFSVEGKEDEYGAFGPISHVEGYANTTTSDANSAHAEGRLNVAKGMASHVEGIENISDGEAAHAEGRYTKALGKWSHAEGGGEQSSGSIRYTIASGDYSHAEGMYTTASGQASHSEGGYFTKASGKYSHAEGHDTSAEGYASHTEGSCTKATNYCEHAEGEYNKSNANTLHSVGIGTSDTDRRNAHEIMQDGKHFVLGVGGYDGTNPTESKDLSACINSIINNARALIYEGRFIIKDDSNNIYIRDEDGNDSLLQPWMLYRHFGRITFSTFFDTPKISFSSNIIIKEELANYYTIDKNIPYIVYHTVIRNLVLYAHFNDYIIKTAIGFDNSIMPFRVKDTYIDMDFRYFMADWLNIYNTGSKQKIRLHNVFLSRNFENKLITTISPIIEFDLNDVILYDIEALRIKNATIKYKEVLINDINLPITATADIDIFGVMNQTKVKILDNNFNIIDEASIITSDNISIYLNTKFGERFVKADNVYSQLYIDHNCTRLGDETNFYYISFSAFPIKFINYKDNLGNYVSMCKYMLPINHEINYGIRGINNFIDVESEDYIWTVFGNNNCITIYSDAKLTGDFNKGNLTGTVTSDFKNLDLL